MDTVAVPHLVVATASEAIAQVNCWRHRAVGMAVHATAAHFEATTCCWHVPLALASATHGTSGGGDVVLHAATDLIQRATRVAAACGMDGGSRRPKEAGAC